MEECEAAGFLAEVDECAFAGGLDHFEGGLQFAVGFSAESAEDIAEEMFGVHSDEDGVVLEE